MYPVFNAYYQIGRLFLDSSCGVSPVETMVTSLLNTAPEKTILAFIIPSKFVELFSILNLLTHKKKRFLLLTGCEKNEITLITSIIFPQ